MAAHILNLTSSWLQWADMHAKPSKSYTVGLKSSTSHLYKPKCDIPSLTVMEAMSTSCPGLNIQIPHNSNTFRKLLTSKLSHIFLDADACPMTMHHKLWLYKGAIYPRLTWLLVIEDLPLAWVEWKSEAMMSCFLKRLAGLERSASTDLYLSAAEG